MPVAPAPSSTAVLAAAGERKQITVLFADVAGSMDLQERLDAEVWAQIMGRFVAILAEGVRKYGGTVDKFTGDGIMALFGAPVAQEDHARRACHAAWELCRTVGEYSEELRRQQGVELNVRLGLNSGEVVVGRVGDDVTLDPTALGHTVGLAQRMEAMAEPGTAYLTEHTVRLVEGWFQLSDLGPITVKGVSEPVGVYALEGPVSSPPILHRAGGLGPAPLVGRERELAVLEDALAMAEQGQAQVVGVVGEAGVGKSRLCDEFVRACAARGVMVRRTAGVSHAQDVSLLPVLALLRAYFDISENDGPDRARNKIAGRLLELDPDLDETLPLLFDFLEVPDPQRPAPPLAAEVRMRRVFETLHRVTQRRSEQQTLVLVFEDLHWFDPQSEAFLERLIESFPGSRTLVVTNFRPEFTSAWMRHSYYRQLPLAPLREQAVGDLLGGLLGGDLSLAPLLGFVLERTGGNPFFVEEVVRALVEDATLAQTDGAYRLTRPLQDVEIPPSVQAVLAARIDRLGERDKRVLQTAAVIGRTFAPPVLRLVAELDDQELDAALSALRAAEFVHEETVSPVVLYRFWHPLTQEVAYQGMLTDQRARLHAAAARAIINHDAGRLDEQSALVATHYERAEDHLEAARWNERAGGFAVRADVGEAMRRWRATLVQLDSAPKTEEAAALGIRVRNRLIRYGARTGMAVYEAGRLYADARALAERLGDPNQLASVTFAYGSTSFWRGAVKDALDRYLEAAHLSDRTDDTDAQAGYWAPPALVFSWTGPVSEGRRALERVVTLCDRNAAVGVSVLGFSPLSALGVGFAELLLLCGRVEEARVALDEGLAIARERGEAEWIAWSLSVYPRLARSSDEFEASLGCAHEALRVAEDSGHTSNHVLALEALGIAQAGLKRFPEAAEALSQALGEARQHQVALFYEGRLLIHLAQTRLGMGQKDAALRAADEAVDVTRRQGAQAVECLALLTRAQIRRALSATTDEPILADLAAALALVKQTGALTYEPFIHEELGRLHHDEKELHQALRLYRQIGATGHARRLEAELSMGG